MRKPIRFIKEWFTNEVLVDILAASRRNHTDAGLLRAIEGKGAPTRGEWDGFCRRAKKHPIGHPYRDLYEEVRKRQQNADPMIKQRLALQQAMEYEQARHEGREE